MISKMVTDRLKANESVVAALENLAPRVSSQAGALLSPYLKKGETMPDVGLLANLLGRMLADRAGAMAKADGKHNDELADDAEPRQERDQAAADLYAAIVDIKQGVANLFGNGWVAKLKLPAEVPQDPTALGRLAGEVKEALGKVKLPKSRVAGVKGFDAAPWVAQIEAPAKRLAKALKDVTREAREAQATLVDKTRAVMAHDEGFSTGVPFTAGLLRLVGEPEHAARLRPSARRPGTLEAEDADAADADDTAEASDAAAPGQDGAKKPE